MGVKGNFKQFFDDVQVEIRKFKMDKRDICITAAVQALADLQKMSPVDKGRYRAAHILTINQVSNEVPPDISAEEKKKRSKSKTTTPCSDYISKTTENTQNALSKLNAARIEDAVRMIIYITNNVDYASFIEDGSYTKDQKAPKAIYAKVRDKTEQRINNEVSKRARRR